MRQQTVKTKLRIWEQEIESLRARQTAESSRFCDLLRSRTSNERPAFAEAIPHSAALQSRLFTWSSQFIVT